MAVDIIQRNAWKASPPKSPHVPMGGPASGTYVHHSVTEAGGNKPSDEQAHMRQLQQIAFGRGFQDISYSFIVFPSGRVYEGRGWGVVGAHTEGSNSTSHAICFVGNFETEEPTKAALQTAADVHRRGLNKGHIKQGGFVRGHRDAPGASTACPGRNLYAKVGKIKRESEKEN